jgi:hypothetical protein
VLARLIRVISWIFLVFPDSNEPRNHTKPITAVLDFTGKAVAAFLDPIADREAHDKLNLIAHSEINTSIWPAPFKDIWSIDAVLVSVLTTRDLFVPEFLFSV